MSSRAVASLSRILRGLEAFNPVVRVISGIGAAVLFLWMAFTFIDVLLRYLFSRPVAGSIEISEMVLAVIVFFGVAYTQRRKSHIRVDVITSQLSPKAAVAMDAATYIVCMGVVAILMWQGIENTISLAQTSEVSAQFRMSLAPAAAAVPLGCLLLLIVLLQDLLASIVEGLKLRFQSRLWIITLVTPAVVMALLGLWMYSSGMSPPIVGVLGLVVMFIFVFLGMPIALALALVAFVFVGHLCGPNAGLEVAGATLYRNVADYSWSVIPLFVLMGFYIVVSELGADVYNSAYKWIGHFPGGLAMATVGGSAGLAAVVGDPAASTITIGTVALPEMKRFNYADSLATGAVSAGATLGPMIPPSIGFIIYGILSRQSIGKLFIAGIIPGLLLAASFIFTIYIACLRNARLGPPGQKSDWGARLSSLKSGGPIALLFLIVIGGIYMGVFSAIEGGGIGAFVAFLIALAMRRVTWQRFVFALTEAGKLISAVIFMIGGCLMFGVVLAASNLSMMLVSFISGLQVSPLVVVAVIMLLYLILGYVMESSIVLILTVPLLTPVAEAMGLDLIWFGVLLVLVTNLGMITPPYGSILFILRTMNKDVSIGTMYRGVMPFVVSTLVVAVLILFFPPLATWLPSMMR